MSQSNSFNGNESAQSDSSTDSPQESVKRLEIPSQFFELIGPVPGHNESYYKCLFTGCVPKRKRDGTPKYLIVANDTRCNAKRHFMKHYPDGEPTWDAAIMALKPKPKAHRVPIIELPIMTQDEFNEVVLDCLVTDVMPLSSVEKPGFRKLLSRTSGNFELYGRTFFTNLLETKFEFRRNQLVDALEKAIDVASTADGWTSRRRSFLGETVHWFDESLNRHSACLAIRRIIGSHTYDVLGKLLHNIHQEFGVAHKLRGTTTDSGSNFLKTFREFGDQSTVPNYDEAAVGSEFVNQENEDSEEEDEEEMIYFEIGDILDWNECEAQQDRQGEQTPPRRLTRFNLPIHRKCACHLLNLVSKADVDKISNRQFKAISIQTERKLQRLWNKQSSSSNNSDIIKRHLGRLFTLKNDTRWNTWYLAISCVLRLIKKKRREFTKMMEELKLPQFDNEDESYMEQYVAITRPMAEALDILQGEKNIGLGFLLPTISILKSKLEKLKDSPSITSCTPLLQGILDGINNRFGEMFNDNELRLAAISNPMFKLSWLQDPNEIARAETLLRGEMNRIRGNNPLEQSMESDSYSSSPEQSPEKEQTPKTKRFFSKLVRRQSPTLEEEATSFLNLCHDVGQLNDYPTMKKIYSRYNVPLPSSASVERLFSHGGLIFTPKRSGLSDRHFEMLLFLKLNRFDSH